MTNDWTLKINLLGQGLNENDNLLIDFCYDSPKSVGELAKLLGIANKNIINRLEKLEEQGLIKINRQGRGKKTLISSNKENQDVASIKRNKDLERWLENPEVPEEYKDSFRRIYKESVMEQSLKK